MKKFILMTILSSFFSLIILIGLIYSVDPYDRLGSNVWGFKTKAVAQSREVKYISLENSYKNYEAFLLGSSAAHRISMKTLKKLTGYESFNYSAQHTNPEDYLAILKHIIEKKKPKLILMQLDFNELDENYITSPQLANSPLRKYTIKSKGNKSFFENNYFTLQALQDSFRVIFVNIFGKALHNNYIEDGDYIYEPIVPKERIKIEQSDYKGWTLSQKRLQILREIKFLCDRLQIKLIVYTAALSFEHFKIARSSPMHNVFLQEITNIFGEIWNFQNESILNYSNYNFFRDSTHVTREFGDIILSRIFKKTPDDLGELLIK